MADQFYEARAEIAKALAHSTRLQIVEILNTEGKHCVCELTEKIDASQSSISKHLSVLKKAGIVAGAKKGNQVFYHLRIPCISNFFNCLDQVLAEDLKRKQQQLKKEGYGD